MRRKLTKDILIKDAKKIHGDKYDYSKMVFETTKKKVTIICPIHGEFKTNILQHINGSGCKECYFNSKRASKEYIIKKANKIHNNKYDYSKYDHTNTVTKGDIICPIHGIFKQTMSNHLRGCGCKECYYDRHKRSTKSFIATSNEIHHNLYSYSNTNVIHVDEKVIIECPKHGEFLQEPSNHMRGRGCPKCNNSKGEGLITALLDEFNIKYNIEHSFNELKGLGGRKLRFDFYIPSKNILIEYDGEFHYMVIQGLTEQKDLEIQQIHDEMKNEYCEKNGLTLIRIPYTMTIDEIKILIHEIL